jgi:hypothetical protein
MTIIAGIIYLGLGAFIETARENVTAQIEISLLKKTMALDAIFDHLEK